MQLPLPLNFTLAPPMPVLLKHGPWLDAGWATACLGFIKKVEVSQTLLDALACLQTEDDLDQHLYDALWLAHHYLVLDQRLSFSFTFDFLQCDKTSGHMTESHLRLHMEEKESIILLGLLQDF